MDYGFISLIPILVLIVGALITKKISEMMIAASVLGALLVYKTDVFSGYISMIYAVLASPTYQFILIILVLFGASVTHYQRSGALRGFRTMINKSSKGSLHPLIIAWILPLFLFIDDYLSTLSVSFVMRDLTDEHRIPREHLAFQLTSLCTSFSVLIPMTGWTAFTISLLREQGLGFGDYVQAIPLMFFPILMILTSLLLALEFLPKVGALKKSYERVEAGGETLVQEEGSAPMLEIDPDDGHKESSVWNFIIPIAVLILVVLLYKSIVHGLIASLIAQGVLYISQRLMTLEEFVNHSFKGAAGMTRMAIVVFFAYMLNEANSAMGFSQYLIGLAGAAISPVALPAIVFLLISMSTFATSGYWMIQIITLPIFIPLAASMGVHLPLVIGALISGAVFGSMFCFYSDVVFIIYAGTGVSNIRQIQVSAPYILTVAAITILLYLLTGWLFC